jgi:hypothetical protein
MRHCGKKNSIGEQAMENNIIRRMRVACWISKATRTQTQTHTHSQYVTIIAFPQQQWLHERSSMLGLRMRTWPVLF